MCAFRTVATPNFLLTHTHLVPREEQKWRAYELLSTSESFVFLLEVLF